MREDRRWCDVASAVCGDPLASRPWQTSLMSPEGSEPATLPEVHVSFTVFGTLDPDRVTGILGVTPSRISRRGSRVQEGRVVIPVEDSWRLEVDGAKTSDATALVEQMIGRLEGLTSPLDRLRAALPEAGLSLTVAAYIPDESSAPSLRLDPSLTSRLAGLRVDFTVDYFVVAREDDPELQSAGLA